MEHAKTADKAHGKDLFVKTCGACHTLADAGTSGKVGPNLDDAFAGPRQQGFAESTFANVIRDQILFPIVNPVGFVTGPNGTKVRAPGMPAKLYTGQDAQDIAAYVASVAGVAEIGATTGATTTSAAPLPPAPTTTAAATTTATTTAQTTTSGGGGSDLAAGKSVFMTAGCTSCHTPHGSVNAKMLTERDANLCLKCHFQEVKSGAILIGGVDHTSRLSQGACWSAGCHEAVHGSRVSPSLRF